MYEPVGTRAGSVAVPLRYEPLSRSVFVLNSAVPGSRCPLTLAVSTAAAAAAAAGAFPTWLQLSGLADSRRGALQGEEEYQISKEEKRKKVGKEREQKH
ncbi:hypothetical protein EYF80_009823 [Liparis tanakae]|uniref:Uncharacterized protein n=1 Tax=Liparis tanakae TaxID=230148 RepID=A0A4Z2IQ27_9TELE|nr:hypothetical protein EYF80_009823 [Liparis tanakae]